MHYYKDGAVRLKRQMLDPGVDSAGWMFKGGTWRIILDSKQLYSNRHLQAI